MKPDPAIQNPKGLFLEPMDTLLLRDGRPFGAADTARSMALPTPQTIAGMLQRHLMKTVGLSADTYHGAVSNNALTPNQRAVRLIACRGPWFSKINSKDSDPASAAIEDLFFPPPATLVRLDKSDKPTRSILKPRENHETLLPGWAESIPNSFNSNDIPFLPLVCKGKHEAVIPESYYLDTTALKQFLSGIRPAGKLIKPDELHCPEERTGLAITPATQTADAGYLYFTQRLRLKRNRGFYVEVGWEENSEDEQRKELLAKIKKQADDPLQVLLDEMFPRSSETILPLGGDGGMVRVRQLNDPFDWNTVCPDVFLTDAQPPAQYFILMITPTIFRADPSSGNSNLPNWHPPEINSLRAVAVPRPLVVSGWELATDEDETGAGGRPRPTRYAVPAGAVYYWQRGKQSDAAKKHPFLMQLAESPSDRAKGWGMALQGVWEPDTNDKSE